jgi:hypothetical protein
MSDKERDPSGRSAHEAGAKLDDGKVRMGLVINGFALALREVAKVGTFGAAKYSDNGWKEVPDGINRYTDALYRHLNDEAAGEVFDSESELMHAALAAWNALARLDLMLQQGGNLTQKEFEDMRKKLMTQSRAPSPEEFIKAGTLSAVMKEREMTRSELAAQFDMECG